MIPLKVYAVIHETWDGIVDIILFQSEHAAKTEMRKLNKARGYDYYKIKEMTVR